MPFNQIGYGPKTNPTAVTPLTLTTGQTYVLPSGQWLVQLGPYTVVQTFDSVTQTWRIFQTPVNSDVIAISSDGSNWRLANISGTIVGAYVVNGGTSAVLPLGIYPANTVTSGNYVVATTTAGAQSSQIGTAATFNVIVGGAISTTVTVTTAGVGYVRPPTLVFSPPPAGGVLATGYISALSSTGISTVVVTNQGAGYTAAPTVTVIPNPLDSVTTTAVLTTTLDTAFTASSTLGRIAAVTVAYNGSGYATVPTITVASGASTTGVSVVPIMALSMITTGTMSGGSANLTDNTASFSIQSKTLASAKTNATTNPFIEAGCYTPRPGYGLIDTTSGVTSTAGTIIDGGLHQQIGTGATTTRVVPAMQWTTAAPTASPVQGTVGFGGFVDTVWLAPL
jgi:hypothetical protein